MDDAVLLQPGTPPIVGKAAFHDFMKQALAKSPSVKVVKYVPDIHDVQVAGNVAYEWGYFDAAQKSSEHKAPESLRAKLLRVMRRPTRWFLEVVPLHPAKNRLVCQGNTALAHHLD